MADALNNHIHDAFSAAIDSAQIVLRPVLRESFRCSVACTDDSRPTSELADCLTACNERTSEVQDFVQAEVDSVQRALGTCQAEALERLRKANKLGGSSTEAEREVLHTLLASEMKPCVDKQLLPLAKLRDRVTLVAAGKPVPALVEAQPKRGW